MKITQLLWALRLSRQGQNNRLPRGYKPVRCTIEEPVEIQLPQPAGEARPFDLSHLKGFETIIFCQPPSARVTAESLARFRVMENVEPVDAQHLNKIFAAAQAKTPE